MLGYLAPSFGVSSSSSEAGDRGVSKDLFVAEIIQSEADEGNPFAQELIKDSRSFLGVASIRSARAARLRKGAMKASRMGYHGLARMGMEAARAEDANATMYAAQVTSLVRRSHGSMFGYITPEEERQQRRNLFLESLSNEQREGVLNELLDRVMQTSVNYGVDDPDAIEVDDKAIDELNAAIQAFGADLDAVFGAKVFKDVASALRPGLKQLTERVDAIEERIDALEAGGGSGPRASRRLKKALRRAKRTGVEAPEAPATVEDLEDKKAIIESKRERVEETLEAAEDAEAASDAMGFVEAGALVDDPRAELPGVDEAIMLSADMFGLSEQRRDKIEKRIERLEKKVLALMEKGASDKKIEAIQNRIERLQNKLDEAEEGKVSEESLPDALVTKQPKAYSKDEFLSSFFGAEGTPRRAFVGFFTRRAEAMGVDVGGMHAQFGAAEADNTRRNLSEFFADVGLSASVAFNPELKKAVREARENARMAFAVDAKRDRFQSARRDYLDALERSRDFVRQVGRYKRGRGEMPELPSRITNFLVRSGDADYRYRKSGNGYEVYKISGKKRLEFRYFESSPKRLPGTFSPDPFKGWSVDNPTAVYQDVPTQPGILQYKSRGPSVAKLQSDLLVLGLFPDKGEVDGVFGRRTFEALAKFQRSQGLPETGVLDATTQARLAAAVDVEEGGPKSMLAARRKRSAGTEVSGLYAYAYGY
jgi:hypothetical protein